MPPGATPDLPKKRAAASARGDVSEADNPVPKGGLVAYLTVEGAIKASEFYKKAFGAEVAAVIPPDD